MNFEVFMIRPEEPNVHSSRILQHPVQIRNGL